MKTIVLMRHAKAEQESGKSDFQRELTAGGVSIARESGAALLAAGISLDRIIASSASRTRVTADLVAEAFAADLKRQDLEELYLAPTREIKATIRAQAWDDETSVLIVGHNPGLAGLICHWAGQSLSVPPATVAVFESTADTWVDVRRKTGHGPKLVLLLQNGTLVWRRGATSDSELSDLS